MHALNCLVAASLLVASLQTAQLPRIGEHWVVSWTGAVQGPYPVGNPSAQPEQKFAFPEPAAGARDQTFRLIVRPDIWGRQAPHPAQQRLRHQTRHHSTALTSACNRAVPR